MKRLMSLICTGLLTAMSAWATDYYVSPVTGNDGNAGTSPAAPWLTFANVNSTAFSAGSRIFLEGSQTHTGNLVFDASDAGTSNNPIVVTSYGTGRATIQAGNGIGLYADTTAGFVISNLNVVGTSRANNVAAQSGIHFLIWNTSAAPGFIQIEAVDCGGFTDYGVWLGSYTGLIETRDLRVTDADVHDNGAGGLLIEASFSHAITNVHVSDVRAYNNFGLAVNTAAGRGIVVGSVVTGVVEHCEAYNNGTTGDGGAGFFFYQCDNITVQRNTAYQNRTRLTTGGSGFECNDAVINSVLQYNRADDNDGAGILLVHDSIFTGLTNVTVRYNISDNDGRKNGYAGLDLDGYIAAAEIHNNTVFLDAATNGAPRAVRIRSSLSSVDVQSVHFRNNIFQTTNSVRLVEVTPNQLDTATDLLFQGNAYFPSGGTFDISWNGSTYSTLDAWRPAAGQESVGATSTGTNLNPRLVNPAGGDLQLAYNSPMIDYGLAISTLFGQSAGAVDLYSNSVPAAGGFDIGAHESTDVLPTSVTLTNSYLALRFARTRPPAAELTYAGLASSNLVDWCVSSCITTQVVDNGNNTETVTVTDTIPFNATNRRFLRVRITTP